VLIIGDLRIEADCALAPMAAVTNAPFRQLCREHGAGLAVTEMVASVALVAGTGAERAERNRALRMERAPGERPLVVQLYGGDPSMMAEAARMVADETGAEVIDVNMGCPVRKINGSGAGVALMREPARAAAIVRAMSDAVRVPITVKIRAGIDDDSITAPEFARTLEGAGAKAIAIHARTKSQVHTGGARWELIAAVKQAVSIPVLGNGGVSSPEEAIRMRRETGCDAVMVGRAAQGNPWFFRGARMGRTYLPSVDERFAAIRRHVALYVEWAGEALAVREVRKHLGWYLRGMAGSATLRARLQDMISQAALHAALDDFEADVKSGRAAAHPRDFPGTHAFA
jgi:tRNA-dihydrouridine synthase B